MRICWLTADAIAFDPSLVGTWTLVAADAQHPDGSRASDYGVAPKGLLLIDAQGHYSLQIFKAERPQFASGDKGEGAQQKRSYELKDGKLSYRVTPRPNEDIPISVWQRLS